MMRTIQSFAAVFIGLSIVACDEEQLTPEPGDVIVEPDYPSNPPVISLPEETCDLAVVIEEAEQYHNIPMCPDTDVQLTISMSNPDSVDIYAKRVSWDGSETTYLIAQLPEGSNTVVLRDGDLIGYHVFAAVHKNSCIDYTPEVFFEGWEFQLPNIEHEEHPILCGPAGTQVLKNSSPASYFQWYKDWEPIQGATNADLVVTEPGEYILKVAYAECPDFWLSNGVGVLVVQTQNVQPVIFQDGNVLRINNVDDVEADVPTYRWFKNGQFIPGAVKSNLDLGANPSGTYSVEVQYWGDEFYAELSDIGRTSECLQNSNELLIN